jgi:hypothetical protein
MIITTIIVASLIGIEWYLDSRGHYKYSVLIGIEGDDDSIEDYRIYANSRSDAEYKARKTYAIDNCVEQRDINVYAIEEL